jgi:inorganic pyrophosphatase
MASILERVTAKAGHGLVNVVIDTPKGSRNKYKYDDEARCFRLGRILPVGMSFPYDFGSIPQTLAEDGDPLDVLVIGQTAAFVGCLVTVRLIGTIRGKQTEKAKTIRNDRLVAVPVTPVNDAEFTHIERLPRSWIEEVVHFFRSYNEAQGRKYEVTGFGGPAQARTALKAAEQRYRREHER